MCAGAGYECTSGEIERIGVTGVGTLKAHASTQMMEEIRAQALRDVLGQQAELEIARTRRGDGSNG